MPEEAGCLVPQLQRTQPERLWFPHQGRVPHTPGFPVKSVGVDKLHAAFLNESRTRGRRLGPRTGNPGNGFAVGDERSRLV